MRLRRTACLAMLGAALALTGCGEGSGRSGTDLVVSGTLETPILYGGDAVMFTMTVSNRGDIEARDVLVRNATLQLSQAALQIDCSASGGATCPAVTGATMEVPVLPAGGSLVFEVRTALVIGANGSFSNTMAASSNTADVNSANNSVTVSGTASSNDLNVAGTAAAPSVPGGGSTAFTLVVNNSGPSTAYDVTLVNTLGPGLALSGAIACTAAGGAQAPVETAGGGLISAAVPVGGVLTCTVPVTVTAGTSGLVFTTFNATAAGESRPIDNTVNVTTVAVSSDLGVSHTAQVQAPAGGALSFKAQVHNPGPSAASNVQITWSSLTPAGVVFDAPTCTPLAGAVCPDVVGPEMSVPSLDPGRTLVFTFNATSAAEVRGDVVNTVAVTADEDIDPSNNVASATTTIVDPRNGSYEVFAADGRRYDLVIDFDALTYTMSGNATSVERSFVADPGSANGFTIEGAARLRLAADLIVGSHDFGAGLLPFVAARSFATNVQALAGTYNLFSRRLAADGTATTVAATAFVSGNSLSICESETANVLPVRQCAAGDRTDFVNLTANGNLFTGTSAKGESFLFKLANSGAAKILLAAGAMPDLRQRLRIGLIDATGGVTFGPVQQGPTSAGDWATMMLVDGNPVIWTSTGQLTSDSAQLGSVSSSGGGPFSMLTGTSSATGGTIYLMQSYPITVVIGINSISSPASGHLQIGLP